MKTNFQTQNRKLIENLRGLTVGIAVAVLFICLSSCNEERLYPSPLPTDVSISTLGYSGMSARIGLGDFEKDTLFQLSGIPEDGNWDYILTIGDYIEEGVIAVVDSKAQFPNLLRSDWWIALEGDSGDTITVEIEIVSTELGYESGVFLVSFVKEMYDIRTWQDLQAMSYDLSGEYTIQNDIEFPDPAQDEFPEQGFVPIGGSTGLSNAFTGTLNGNGYTIKDFYIGRAYMNYVGLFGVLSYTAVVQNLKIELSELGVTGYNYVGGLAGYAGKSTLIEDCELEGNVYGNDYVGGLTGYLSDNSTMSLCRVTGQVQGNSKTGGLLGASAVGSNIEYCFAAVSVSGTDALGGLVGHSYGSVSNCQVDEVIISGKRYIGGFIGHNIGVVNSSSVAEGIVDGDSLVGGFIGYSESTAGVYMSCSKTTVSGLGVIGGFIGRNDGEVTNSYSAGGEVSGATSIGGFIGVSNNLVMNCYTGSDVTSGSPAGGFMGQKYGTATKCYWSEGSNTSLSSTGSDDESGIEKKELEAFLNFDPTVTGVRDIFLGWDFEDTWIILSTKNDGFPYLSIERNLSIEF